MGTLRAHHFPMSFYKGHPAEPERPAEPAPFSPTEGFSPSESYAAYPAAQSPDPELQEILATLVQVRDLASGWAAFVVTPSGEVLVAPSSGQVGGPAGGLVRSGEGIEPSTLERLQRLGRSCLEHPGAAGQMAFAAVEPPDAAYPNRAALVAQVIPVHRGGAAMPGGGPGHLEDPRQAAPLSKGAGGYGLPEEHGASLELLGLLGIVTASVAPFGDDVRTGVVALDGILAALLERRGHSVPGEAAPAGTSFGLTLSSGASSTASTAQRSWPRGDDLLAQALLALPVGALICRHDGVLLFSNRRAGEMLGSRPEEMLGRDLSELLHLGEASPPDLATLASAGSRQMEIALPGGWSTRVEISAALLAASGPGAEAVVLLRPVGQGEPNALGKQLVGAFYSSLGRVLESLDEGFVACDAEATVLFSNAKAAELHGFAPERLAAGASYPFVSGLRAPDGGILPAGRHPMALALAGNAVRGETLVFMDDRQGERTVEVSAAQLNVFGGGIAALMVLREVTGQGGTQNQPSTLALRDPLTGLANRWLMQDYLARMLCRGRREAIGLWVALLDLDDFKSVNAELGNLAGDEVLNAVANRLRGAVRESDMVARLGADEFAVVGCTEGPASETAVQDVVRRVDGALGAPYRVAGRTVLVHASIGAVIADSQVDDPTSLLVRADLARYKEKTRQRHLQRNGNENQ